MTKGLAQAERDLLTSCVPFTKRLAGRHPGRDPQPIVRNGSCYAPTVIEVPLTGPDSSTAAISVFVVARCAQ
jgi:hypothetical protein